MEKTQNSNGNNTVVKYKSVPYVLYIIILVVILLGAACIAIYFIAKTVNAQPALAASSFAQDVDSVKITDALSIMQEQYNTHLTSLSMLLTTAIAIMSIFGIIMPVFNYIFFQRDQINRINSEIEVNKNEALDIINREIKIMETTIATETERLQRIIYQSTDFLEAYLDEEHIAEIKPLSDSQIDIAHSYYLESRLAFLKNDYYSALKALDRAIKHDSKRAEFYNRRAIAYRYLCKYDEALEDIEKALALSKENGGMKELASYYYSKGVILDSKADHTKQKELYEAALFEKKRAAKYNENPHYYFSIGLTEDKLDEKLERFDCISDLERAINIGHGDNALFHKTLGHMYFKREKYSFALEHYVKSLKYNSNDAETYKGCSDCKQQQELYIKAIPDEFMAFAITNNAQELKRRVTYLLQLHIEQIPEENDREKQKYRDIFDTLYEIL